MLVTTARNKPDLEEEAQRIARDLNIPYYPRESYSISRLCQQYEVDQLVVLTRERLSCVFCDDTRHPLFFHPNSAMFRLRRLRKGGDDLFASACQLEKGMKVLDCTLGLASDAIVASYITGEEGEVVGLESVPVLAYIVQEGLQHWQTEHEAYDQAMRRIQVKTDDHAQFLKQCHTNEYDVVYFDPMFEKTVHTSKGISPLKKVADTDDLNEEIVNEAKRVAKKRVVMKDSKGSSRFSRFGFQVEERPYASQWFGFIQSPTSS